jgi:outer membrane protein OmpA-like peptidoglycan-associated protein
MNPSKKASSSSESNIAQPLNDLISLLQELNESNQEQSDELTTSVDNSPESETTTKEEKSELTKSSITNFEDFESSNSDYLKVIEIDLEGDTNNLNIPLIEEKETIIYPNQISQNSEYPDINVEIDTELKSKLTLLEAVEYEAFLRRTVEPNEEFSRLAINSNSTQPHSIETYPLEDRDRPESQSQELAELEATLAQKDIEVEDLADSLNNLIPLIVELLKYKTDYSREAILAAVAPIIDRIIEQRSEQDQVKMAQAIAKILPHAITSEIQRTPQAIAKAIAPEIALAIEEQIRLDRNAISHALGSEMGKAIKTQIELEKDAMVDALYPVIGSTISKYMVEVVQSINAQVENALSIEGFKRKIRARLQGVSEAELIFTEAVNYQVQAVFLIDKDSGLVIQEAQSDLEHRLESDMIAGMLTAIRSFANDCIASGSELDEIDYGDWQIPIEVAGYCYLAAIVKGEPSKQFRQKIRHTFSNIVMKYGDAIEIYGGDSSTVPQGIQLSLQDLVASNDKKQKSSSSPTTLIWLLAIFLGIIFIPWGIIHHRGVVAERIAQETAVQLDAAPELSVYRLDSSVSKGKLTLTGRVPSTYLRAQAAAVGSKIAEEHNLELDNRIVAINIPPEPGVTASEIARLTDVFNQQPQIAITSQYQPQTVTIKGLVIQERDLQAIKSAFRRIPGIETVIITVEDRLPTLDTRIYFDSDSTKVNLEANSSKIKAIKELLAQYPQLHWQIIGYSDRQGTSSKNQQLGLERAKSVRAALVNRGVNPSQLEISYDDKLPPGVEPNQSLWLSRCVRLEPFFPRT